MAVLYGLLNMADLAAARVTEVGVDEVTASIEQNVAEHNRQINSMNALFVERTTEFKGRFFGSAATRLQPLDNSGRARPIKPVAQYDVSWPLQQAGIAWGHDYVTGQYMTVGEVARATATMMDADFRWIRDHILGALFLDGSWSFVDDLHGTLTVYGPASGDSTVYNIMTGADAEATDDHMKGTAAIAVATFTDIKTELLEHPENGGDVITFISTADEAAVKALTGFYPILDADITQGTGTTQLTGTLDAQVPGDVIGKIEENWVVVWRSMPANYAIGVTTEGAKALRMREDPIDALRGFNRVADRNDHPWYERQYLRRAGFGAFNRVGAVVYKTNNATYTAPANYTSPMP